MDIIMIESRSPNFFSKLLSAVQKYAGTTEEKREFWPTHVVIKANGVKMPDGDEIVWESSWDSPYLRMNYWSRFKHRKYRVWRDINNLQTFGSIKNKTCKKMYGYMQILGYLPILFGTKKRNIWPNGEVCNETAHIWAIEHGYLKKYPDVDPSGVWPVQLEDMLRDSKEFVLNEEKM